MADYAPKPASSDRRTPDPSNSLRVASGQQAWTADAPLASARGLQPRDGLIAQLQRSLKESPRLARLVQLSGALQRQPQRSASRDRTGVVQAKWFWHRTLKGMGNAMAQEMRARRLHLEAQMAGVMNTALAGPMADRETRKQEIKTAEAIEKQNIIAMADLYQRRIYTGVFATEQAGVTAYRAAANASIVNAVATA